MSEQEWDEKSWARESEPLTASPQLGATIAIKLDLECDLVVRHAARLLGMTNSQIVKHVAVTAAAEAFDEVKR